MNEQLIYPVPKRSLDFSKKRSFDWPISPSVDLYLFADGGVKSRLRQATPALKTRCIPDALLLSPTRACREQWHF